VSWASWRKWWLKQEFYLRRRESILGHQACGNLYACEWNIGMDSARIQTIEAWLVGSYSFELSSKKITRKHTGKESIYSVPSKRKYRAKSRWLLCSGMDITAINARGFWADSTEFEPNQKPSRTYLVVNQVYASWNLSQIIETLSRVCGISPGRWK